MLQAPGPFTSLRRERDLGHNEIEERNWMSRFEELQHEFFTPHADQGLLISQIEDTREPEAARFLLRVAGSEEQADIIRIEALKVLRDWECGGRELQDEIGVGVLKVAQSSLDDLVQTHAVMILGRYVHCQGVAGFLAQTVLDDSRDLDVRHNALEALRPHMQVAEVDAVLRRTAGMSDSVGRRAQELLDRPGR